MDNCTLYPEGTWTECCARHDRRYENKRLSKWQADKLLYRCVKKKSSKVNAAIMWLGVTLFGWFAYYRATNKGDSYVVKD